MSVMWCVEDVDADAEAAGGTDKSADKYGLGNKNEVMMLHELCAKKGIRLDAQVADKVDRDGQVYCFDHTVIVHTNHLCM